MANVQEMASDFVISGLQYYVHVAKLKFAIFYRTWENVHSSHIQFHKFSDS